MKLGFSTLGCPDWSWEEILNTARDMGIDGIEVRGIQQEIDPLDLDIFAPTRLPATLEQLSGFGLEIPMLASSVCLGVQDGPEQAQRARAHIDFAACAGIPFVRVLISPETHPDPVDFQQARQLYAQLCQHAKEQGVTVLAESNGILADSARMRDFLSLADPSASGVLWDIHHPYRYFGETPAQTVELLGDRIKYVHLKDSVMEGGVPQYRMMGLGDLPVYDAVKALHRQGYTGYLMLEWVKRWAPELRDPDVIFYHYQNYMETLLEEIEREA